MTNYNWYYTKSVSLKRTEGVNEMLNYLEKKLLLNPSSIMKLGLATLYEQEKSKEGVTHE